MQIFHVHFIFKHTDLIARIDEKLEMSDFEPTQAIPLFDSSDDETDEEEPGTERKPVRIITRNNLIEHPITC